MKQLPLSGVIIVSIEHVIATPGDAANLLI